MKRPPSPKKEDGLAVEDEGGAVEDEDGAQPAEASWSIDSAALLVVPGGMVWIFFYQKL
jgi:hypothetical protein